MIDYETGLNMAATMKKKDRDLAIRKAITKCQIDRHGVVALKFSEQGREMEIEILDEPYSDDVRIYPG